jgi:hypothetical protein
MEGQDNLFFESSRRLPTARSGHGETKACDAQFYADWESGLIDKMFPEWF